MQGADLAGARGEFSRLRAWSQIALTSPDLAIARTMSGVFWLIGATVAAVLLPLEPPTDAIGDVGWSLAVIGVLAAFFVGVRHLGPNVSLLRIYVAGYVGVAMIVVLEWLAGGRETPYHYLFILPVLYAAGAQSPRRVLVFAATVSVVIWLPLVYEGTGREIVVDIGTQAVTLLALGASVWALFTVLRRQRRTISEQRLQAESMAREDVLTRLGNRRAFIEALPREIARAEREGGSLSVLIADLDDFKNINDRHGHAAGDECLRRAADILSRAARRGDGCFRWGGDEFALLLPRATRVQAEAVAARLQDLMAAEVEHSLRITCGVAELEAGQSPETLIATADRDLMARKQGVA